MWLLISTKNQDVRFQLLVGEDYVVGRKDCSILIQNDQSISRKHATLQVSHPEVNLGQPQRPPILTVKDESRFGTVVRGEKVNPQEQRILKNGDIIKFGTVDSIFQAVYEPLLVTTSCLDAAAKKQTKTLVARLGGHVVSEWRKECQLLVMSSLSVTVKVICALVSQKSIVTPQYLTDLVNSVKANEGSPDPERYIPTLVESQLNPAEVSFKEDIRRKSLFQGKVFVFLSQKQFNKLNLAIELAGGTPILMEEGSDDNEDDIIISKTTCVMACDSSDSSQNLTKNAQEWIKHVMNLLKRNKRRPIPDSELGYAVLYCSTDKYCNPMVDPGCSGDHLPSQTLSQQPIESLPNAEVLVHDTEQELNSSRTRIPSGPCVVPASPESQNNIKEQDKPTKSTEDPLIQTVKTEISSQNDAAPAAEKNNTQTRKTKIVAGKKTNITSFFERKRPRESDDDSAASSEAPPRKRNPFTSTDQDENVLLPNIKVEKSTPIKPRGIGGIINVDSRGVSPSRETRTHKANSSTPKQLPKNRKLDGEGNVQVVKEEISDDLFDFGTRRKRTRSPSPEHDVSGGEEDLFDFGARKNRKSQKAKSSSPKPKQTELSDVEDPFDFGARRSQRVRKSKSPSPKPDSLTTSRLRSSPRRNQSPGRDKEGSTRHTRSSRSPSPKPDSWTTSRLRSSPRPNQSPGRDKENGSRQTRSSRSPTPVKSHGDLNNEDIADSLVGKSKGKGRGKGVGRNGEGSAVQTTEETNNNLQPDDVKVEAVSNEENGTIAGNYDAGSVPQGFLTSVKPIQDQLCRLNKDYVSEADLPSRCLQTEFKSLLMRKPKQPKSTATRGDIITWKGKPVKNFKKFRKSGYAGMAGLPQIIGRTDLVVHTNKAGREVESWFEEEAQAENQQNEMERLAQDLFDYVPPKKRKGTRR